MLTCYIILSLVKYTGTIEETCNSFFCVTPQNQALDESFPQITQKILTKDIFHWLEQITQILRFLQMFSLRKITTQLF